MRRLIEQLEDRHLFSGIDHFGDANNDGRVDVVDFVIVAQHFNQIVVNGPSVGDFNDSGLVNSLDLNTLATNFGVEMTNYTGAALDDDFQNAANWDNGVPTLVNIGQFTASEGFTLSNVPTTAFHLNATSSFIDLGGATLHHSTLLTVTDDSTFFNFTWLSPNAGASQTGSTTVAQGATISGTYDGRYGAILTVATLDNADDVDSFVASGGSTANETFSFVLASGSVNPSIGNHTLRVRDGLNSVTINLPDITVIAASTGGSAAITQQQQLIRRHHHHAS